MPNNVNNIVMIGAGINGLVAANYLQRAGYQVDLIERKPHVGGACVAATANVSGVSQDYALGASVLGFMQDFVWQETGLAARLDVFAPTHPKLVHFPERQEPTWIYREPDRLDREFAQKWGEQGDLKAFRADEARVVEYLQQGYRDAKAPSLETAKTELGDALTRLWITGSAVDLLDHYLTAEGTKVYMAMTVNESGPVSLHEPFSAFVIPLMSSGSVFEGYYGFVKGGIWQIPTTLEEINRSLGVRIHVASEVVEVDIGSGRVIVEKSDKRLELPFDHLCLATDPVTAAQLVGDADLQQQTEAQRLTGSSGKLNLMFKNPVRWKHGSQRGDSDSAFRFIFSVDSLEAFEATTLAVMQPKCQYQPGYAQVYCEGAAMRQLGLSEPFDRLAVFFKNLSLNLPGEALPEVELQVKQLVLDYVQNPEDLVWSRLLTPRDLQETFLFPGGNLDHTMLVGGQVFADRGYSADRDGHFYRFGNHQNVSVCGAGTYPCGSVAGTPGYMCARQLMDMNG